MAVINLEARPQLLTGEGLGVLETDSQPWMLAADPGCYKTSQCEGFTPRNLNYTNLG